MFISISMAFARAHDAGFIFHVDHVVVIAPLLYE